MMIGPPESEQTATPDAVLSALNDEHRRAVLRTLNDADEKGMTLKDLADVVASQVQAESNANEIPRHRVRTVLHHSHLPKLDDYGLVQYDPEQRHVQNGPGEMGQKLLVLLETYDDDGSVSR